MPDLVSTAHKLLAGEVIEDASVVLDLGDFRIDIRSNSQRLLDRMRCYFAHVVARGAREIGGTGDVVVHAIEAPPTDLGLEFVDWRREPGKTGRKDAYHDLYRDDRCDGRLVRKVRTGMLFLQSEDHRIARGPCLANDNQVINFINCQYMNWLQRRGAVICHASSIVFEGRALAIAGFSGGGKSSLMLRLLESPRGQFLTNDRLFLESAPGGDIRAIGIPKLPRVNPGTILSLPSLQPILNQQQHDAFKSLASDSLWNVEEKYDVDVSVLYGPNRIVSQSRLTDLIVLNWKRASKEDCRIKSVNIKERPDLLGAVAKSPGPFYSDSNGVFQSDGAGEDHRPYGELLEKINVWEASGSIDFALAANRCREILRADPCQKTS